MSEALHQIARQEEQAAVQELPAGTYRAKVGDVKETIKGIKVDFVVIDELGGCERVRPPLPGWGELKSFDLFPGFDVVKGAVKHDEYNPPKRELHPLQKMTNGDKPWRG